MTSWNDYIKRLPNGESYSERVTRSGHITVSAKINSDGSLEAFPPRGAERVYPVFIILNSTSGGRISEVFEGKYPQKGWQLSSAIHKGRGRLWKIFMDLYAEIHLSNPPEKEEKIEDSSKEENAPVLFSEGWKMIEESFEAFFNNMIAIEGDHDSCLNAVEVLEQEREKFASEVKGLTGKNFKDILYIRKTLNRLIEDE